MRSRDSWWFVTLLMLLGWSTLVHASPAAVFTWAYGDATGIVGFVIEGRQPTGLWHELDRVAPDVRMWTDTHVVPGVRYCWRVRAMVTAEQALEPSEEWCATVPVPAPQGTPVACEGTVVTHKLALTCRDRGGAVLWTCTGWLPKSPTRWVAVCTPGG